jgi:hypothetical protein
MSAIQHCNYLDSYNQEKVYFLYGLVFGGDLQSNGCLTTNGFATFLHVAQLCLLLGTVCFFIAEVGVLYRS